MERQIGLLIVSMLMMLPSSGCSIVMALNGHAEPNFDNVKAGTTREQVEFEFGTPLSSLQRENGQYEVTYKYEMGNSPNAARATVYTYVDLATIGLAEPVLSLIELLQGHDEMTDVLYGSDHRVIKISGYIPPAQSKELAAAVDEQDKWVRKAPRPPLEEKDLSQARVRSGE